MALQGWFSRIWDKLSADKTVSQIEAEAGTGTAARLWTPERVLQAIDALAPGGVGDALVANTLDQFADVTQTATKTLAITESTTLAGGTHSGTNTGDQTNISGNAATVTTNANLTGPITSTGNATAVASQTGTGSKFVMDASPTLVTPVLGVATATSVNKVAITAPATSATLTIADGASLITVGAFSVTFTASATTTLTLPTTGTLATLAGTETLTNKRLTDRVQSVADAATITPDADSNDCVDITAIAQAFTIANPTGTPTNFQRLRIRIKDNGTARAITFGSAYVAGGTALPTTTVLSKIMLLGFEYDTANGLNKWRLVANAQEA